MRKKILLIEDNKKYSETARQVLEEKGHEVHLAEDYVTGIKALDAYNPEWVVTDLFMPDEKGSGRTSTGSKLVDMMEATDWRRTNEEYQRLSKGKVEKNYKALREAIRKSEENQPLGILIFEEASERRNLPTVIATSTYHHDDLGNAPHVYHLGQQKRSGITFVECHPEEVLAGGQEPAFISEQLKGQNDKTNKLFWEQVLRALEYDP